MPIFLQPINTDQIIFCNLETVRSTNQNYSSVIASTYFHRSDSILYVSACVSWDKLPVQNFLCKYRSCIWIPFLRELWDGHSRKMLVWRFYYRFHTWTVFLKRKKNDIKMMFFHNTQNCNIILALFKFRSNSTKRLPLKQPKGFIRFVWNLNSDQHDESCHMCW